MRQRPPHPTPGPHVPLAPAEWNERRSRVGQYPSLGADWRTDVRCQGTGNPTDPDYREWTHKEVWDLITMGGINADPRDVALFVRNPLEIAGGWVGGRGARAAGAGGWAAP